MWKDWINDVQKIAISKALCDVRDALPWLSSIQDTTRQNAYAIIVDALGKVEGLNEVPTTTIPRFFMEGGDLLTALWYVREGIRTGVSMDAVFVSWLVQKACQKYIISRQTWKDSDPQVEEHIESYRDSVRTLLTWIVWDMSTDTPSYFALAAYVACHIDADVRKTIELLVQAISMNPKDPTNYLHLGQVYHNMKDLTEASRIFALWLENTGDHRLFEAIIKLSSRYFGDVWAKAFYTHYKPDDYGRPYSYVRWVYKYDDSQDDLRYSILLAVGEEDLTGTFPQYTKSALTVMDGQIGRLMHLLRYDSWSTFSDILRKDKETLEELIECFETEIFYLMSFRHLSLYLKILSQYTKTQKWQTRLGEYFWENILDGIMDESDESAKVSIAHPEEDTPTLQADISWGWTLKESLAARLSFIMIHTSQHTSDTGSFLWDSRIPHTGYTEEMLLMHKISAGYIWPAMVSGWEYFERKRIDEEINMMHLGSRTWDEYDAFVEDIDDEYGITVRRYLAHAARTDKYIWWALPPLCTEGTHFLYFFIAERLIAWKINLFKDELPRILERLDTTDFALVITLAEILMVQSYYQEAVELVCRCPDALDDVDALMVLVASLTKYSGSEEEIQKLHIHVNETLSIEYGQVSLFDYVYGLYQENHTALMWKIAQEALTQDGELIVSEERLDEVERLGMFEYMSGVLLDDTDAEARGGLLTDAISHGSAEALMLRALDDRENGADRENILEGLISYFPRTEYPVRRDFLSWIVDLAWETGQVDRATQFIRIARIEGIDILSLMAGEFWGSSEKRSLFYTLYIQEGFDTNLWDAALDYLRQGIERDMQDDSLPPLTRISAAFVQTQISPSDTLLYIPGYLYYWNFLVQGLVRDPVDSSLMELYAGFIADIHPDFDPDEISKGSLLWVAALQFQAMHIYAFIRNTFEQEAKKWASKENLRETLELTLTFIKNTLLLIAHIPDFRSITNIEMIDPEWEEAPDGTILCRGVIPNKQARTLAVPDFWKQEYACISADIASLDHIESGLSNSLPVPMPWDKHRYISLSPPTLQ